MAPVASVSGGSGGNNVSTGSWLGGVLVRSLHPCSFEVVIDVERPAEAWVRKSAGDGPATEESLLELDGGRYCWTYGLQLLSLRAAQDVAQMAHHFVRVRT